MKSLVVLENDQAVTTSLQIAESFEREHHDVIKSINRLEKDIGTFSEMFRETNIEDSYGRDRKAYYMNRDGFTLLAMGFTGKKALEFKLEYINQFNKMERSINELYHVSKTALTNNIMNDIVPMLNSEVKKITNKIDDRLELYEDNYRPTHANKIKINNYIKDSLGADREPDEADLVKQRVLLMLDAETWQDVPYRKLTGNMRLIDESIQAVKGFRTRKQLDLFESYL